MLKLFCGTEPIAIRSAVIALVNDLPYVENRVERLEAEDVSPARLATMTGSVSLFGEKTTYIMETPSLVADNFSALLGVLGECAASNNLIVVIEGAVLAPIKKQFEKAGASIEEFKSGTKATAYDPFKMNAALLARDKKLLWVLLTEAERSGIASEETVGILWWQLKTLRLAALYGTASAAGVSQYPYDQAKKALRNFKPGEVESLAHDLLHIYHEARQGRQDMALSLEAWVLRM
jgi:DNA polymerase III delta subunit